MIEKNSKIFVAGHNGLAGSAILRTLSNKGYKNIITRTHEDLDLQIQKDVNDFIAAEKPDAIFLAAAKVGGIHANSTYKADFIYNNLIIQCNVINSAYRNQVKNLLFLGSTCIYPRLAPQPMKEDDLLSGKLEPTNESYAVAKIAGLKLIEAFNIQYKTKYTSVMPTNMYGPFDNFNNENGHVLPVLLRRFHEAKINNLKEVVIWGSGKPKREFLFSDDMADASIFLMEKGFSNGFVNIGTGEEISIIDLAKLISKIVDYKGDIILDKTKPDGSPRKLADITLLKDLGWKPITPLEEGLKKTYAWFLDNPNFKK